MKRFSTLLVTFTSLVLFCATTLGFAASAFWLFDLLNHFRFQFMIAGVLGLCLALALRSKPSAWIYATIVLINALFVAPLFHPHPIPPKSLIEISLISYNTWIHNGDSASVLATMQDGDPDVIYLTETHRNIQAGIHALESEFHIFQVDTDVLLVRRRAGLSPRLIQASTGDGIAGIAVKLSLGGMDVTFLGVHPTAPLSAGFARNRDESFSAMVTFLKKQEGLKIMVGDFNATPWSWSFRNLQEQTDLENSQKGFGIQSTWPSYPGSNWNWLLRIPIDHCLHSRSFYTMERRVGDHGRSNHNPIFIRLGIQSRPTTGGITTDFPTSF